MSNDKLLTPRFLTPEIARFAVHNVLQATFHNPVFSRLLDGEDFHIVILVPSTDDGRPDYLAWPNYMVKRHVLYEESLRRNRLTWEKYPLDNIARCKVYQLAQERNDGGSDIKPHLLFPDETIYWGGVHRDGLDVAGSGVQPHFDRMISGMVADQLIALSYDAWMESKDKKEGRNFLGPHDPDEMLRYFLNPPRGWTHTGGYTIELPQEVDVSIIPSFLHIDDQAITITKGEIREMGGAVDFISHDGGTKNEFALGYAHIKVIRDSEGKPLWVNDNFR